MPPKPETKQPTDAELDAQFDKAVAKMTMTVTHPIDRTDLMPSEEKRGIMFAEPEIEKVCKALHRSNGAPVLAMIEGTLGGAVTNAHVAKWTKELKKKAAE